VAVFETVVSALLTILKVTGFGFGTSTEGAVYLHVRGATVVQAVSVPCVALPFVTPLTLQVRPKLLVPVTVAVRVKVPPKATVEAEVFSVRVIAACAVLAPQAQASAKAKHDRASFFIGLFPLDAL
jgi:hypothetical protein